MGSIYLENWKVFNFHINLLSTLTNQQLGCQIFGFRAKNLHFVEIKHDIFQPWKFENQMRYFSFTVRTQNPQE